MKISDLAPNFNKVFNLVSRTPEGSPKTSTAKSIFAKMLLCLLILEIILTRPKIGARSVYVAIPHFIGIYDDIYTIYTSMFLY